MTDVVEVGENQIVCVFVACKECGGSVLTLWTPDGYQIPDSCSEHS